MNWLTNLLMGEPVDIIFILGIPALIVFLVVWFYLGVRWIIDMYRWKKERRMRKSFSKER